MILGISIGNTNIRCAVGTKEKNKQINMLTDIINCTDNFISSLEEQFNKDVWNIIQGSIVTSVVSVKTNIIISAIWHKTNKPPQRIELSKLNIDVSGYKSVLGEDRAICCAAALSKYTPPIIVIDLGTATTINVVDANGRFLGGAISAGVQTGLKALCEHTALLPQINDFFNTAQAAAAIGSDTQKGLISGAVIGTACMLEGYISRIGTGLRTTPTVIVTGGNAPIVLPHCGFDFIHMPTLLIDELFSLYIP